MAGSFGHTLPTATDSTVGPSPTSVAILGAGMVGLTLAWRLSQAGWQVTVFDASRAAAEASWAGAGMLAPGGEVFTDSPHARELLAARDAYPAFVAELSAASGLSIDFQAAGALDLAYSDADWQALNQRAAVQRSFGIASKVLPPERVHVFWPHLRHHELAGAVFYPDDSVVNPREVNAALLTVLRLRGVTLRESSPIRGLAVHPGYVELDGNGRFARAVIAAGAWSAQLQLAGAAPLPPLPPVEPVHGMLIGYPQPEQTCPNIVRHGATYLFQRANGLLVVGASSHRLGFSRAAEPATQSKLEREARQVFLHLGETSPTEVWTGLRPYADAPHVQPWHSHRLWLAYGHYRNGILLADHTARTIVSEWTRRQV